MTLILKAKFIICAYVRTNMLIQRFRMCSEHVKIAIFMAYCIRL